MNKKSRLVVRRLTKFAAYCTTRQRIQELAFSLYISDVQWFNPEEATRLLQKLDNGVRLTERVQALM